MTLYRFNDMTFSITSRTRIPLLAQETKHAMPQRIHDQYVPDDQVEIHLIHLDRNIWQAAVVLRAEPPGLWVQTEDGREWFVTNTYRIRPAGEGTRGQGLEEELSSPSP